jgi:hypothetical protein
MGRQMAENGNHVLRVNCVEEEAAFRGAVQEVISRVLADKPGGR